MAVLNHNLECGAAWDTAGPCANDPTGTTKAVQRTAKKNRKAAVPRAFLESISSL